MKAEIIKDSEELIGIEWSCPEKGHGQLIVKPNHRGGWDIDSEYMSLETVVKILTAAGIK